MSEPNTNSVASSSTSLLDQWKRLRSEQHPKGGKKTGGGTSSESSGSAYTPQNQSTSSNSTKHGYTPSRQRAPKYCLQWMGYGDLEPSGCPPWFLG